MKIDPQLMMVVEKLDYRVNCGDVATSAGLDKDTSEEFVRLPQCLRERKWKFSKANYTQIRWAFGLFIANIVGIEILAIMLGKYLISGSLGAAMLVLNIYGIGLVTIPSIRYFWVKYQDLQVRRRNRTRHQQVSLLKQLDLIKEKLNYAKQFAKQHKITDQDIIYTTEEDALGQDIKRQKSELIE